MAKISLRMYNREIEGLIEQQRLEEAIAHCRHILKSYPKHLETYRMLGKAYLEAKRYDQAVDIFQRILVSAPDDFVSHVGMSIIADDNGKLDDAIWHMERAFEVQPSNAAIQGELQRLFGRRDGVEPPKIRLTRGALAHMYVQGELYNQAISEIHLVLSNDPKRTDMQTLLARAYFLNGQKTEATDTCNELLARYQYCLDANRLMAEIVPGTSHPESAQEYRQRVIELDPYAAFVQDSLFRSDTVADGLVTLERLEYTGETGEMPPMLGIGLESDSDLGRRAGAQAPAGPRTVSSGSDLPAWLSGVADDSGSKSGAVAPSADKSDIPEFLRDAGWGSSSEAGTAETPSPFAEQASEEPAEGSAIEGDLPDWVKALAPAADKSTSASSSVLPPESSALPQEDSPFASSFSADTPDWLRGLSDMEAPQPATPEQPVSPPPTPESSALPADLPDWLRDMGPAAPGSTAPAAPSEETPDWLKDLAGRELDEPSAPAVPFQSSSESDWLGDLRAEQTAAPLEAAEESPDWLKEFDNDLETPLSRAEAPEETSTPPAIPGSPALSASAPTVPEPPVPPAAVPMAPEPPAPPAAFPVSPEPAASLGSLGTTAQEQDDAMAWLEGLAAKHGAKPEELVTDPNARTEIAPEWVDRAKEIAEQVEEPVPAVTPPVAPPAPAAATPAAPFEDETGMWLRSLEAEVSEANAPKPEAEQPSPEERFDLRSNFAEESTFTAIEPEAEPEPEKVEQPGTSAAEPPPSWLSGYGSKTTEPAGLEDAPDWLRRPSKEMEETEQPEATAQSETENPFAMPEAQAENEPELFEESTDLPAWLAGLDREESATAAPASGAEPSEELPAWLQSEIEPEPEVKEPARPTDWRPLQAAPSEMPQPVAPTKPLAEEPAPPAAPPAAARPVMEEPAPPVAVEPVVEQPAPPPPPPAPKPVVERAPAPAPMRSRPAPAAKPVMLSIGDAQTQMGRGNITAALDIYGKLIRKGKSLEDIIRDLRDALYRYPVEVPLWQSLGDAYMRANRLQEALDAYTKAEELLR